MSAHIKYEVDLEIVAIDRKTVTVLINGKTLKFRVGDTATYTVELNTGIQA